MLWTHLILTVWTSYEPLTKNDTYEQVYFKWIKNIQFEEWILKQMTLINLLWPGSCYELLLLLQTSYEPLMQMTLMNKFVLSESKLFSLKSVVRFSIKWLLWTCYEQVPVMNSYDSYSVTCYEPLINHWRKMTFMNKFVLTESKTFSLKNVIWFSNKSLLLICYEQVPVINSYEPVMNLLWTIDTNNSSEQVCFK